MQGLQGAATGRGVSPGQCAWWSEESLCLQGRFTAKGERLTLHVEWHSADPSLGPWECFLKSQLTPQRVDSHKAGPQGASALSREVDRWEGGDRETWSAIWLVQPPTSMKHEERGPQL